MKGADLVAAREPNRRLDRVLSRRRHSPWQHRHCDATHDEGADQDDRHPPERGCIDEDDHALVADEQLRHVALTQDVHGKEVAPLSRVSPRPFRPQGASKEGIKGRIGGLR